jgi:FtsH-binding integral membrane protein
MTTIDKFHDAVTGHFSRSRRMVWSLMAAGLVLFGCGWQAVPILFSQGSTQEYAFIILIIGLVSVTVVAITLGACGNEGRLGLDPRLRCPHCDRAMQIHGALVMETGICPWCRCRVLADWIDPPVVEKSEREPESIVPHPAERIQQRQSGARLALLGIMAVAVYVLVTGALVSLAVTIPWSQKSPLARPLFLILIPVIPLLLPTLILSPGPRRDWISMLFTVLLMGVWLVGPALLLLNSVGISGRIVLGLVAVFVVFGANGIVVHGKRFLTLQGCPACGLKKLVHAARQQPGMRTYHDYYWCMNCYERYKRLCGGPWEPAWSPHDDHFYWLWSSRQSIRTWFGRILRKTQWDG